MSYPCEFGCAWENCARLVCEALPRRPTSIMCKAHAHLSRRTYARCLLRVLQEVSKVHLHKCAGISLIISEQPSRTLNPKLWIRRGCWQQPIIQAHADAQASKAVSCLFFLPFICLSDLQVLVYCACVPDVRTGLMPYTGRGSLASPRHTIFLLNSLLEPERRFKDWGPKPLSAKGFTAKWTMSASQERESFELGFVCHCFSKWSMYSSSFTHLVRCLSGTWGPCLCESFGSCLTMWTI